MAQQIKIKPPYSPAIIKAHEEGMSYEAIDAAIGWEKGNSEKMHKEYMRLVEEIRHYETI